MSHTATCHLDPAHSHALFEDHGHSHGLVDSSIKRSRAGLRAVGVSPAILTVTAAIYAATGSIALLADLIHNAGDALTAVPLGAAFLLRSERAEHGAGIAVVLTILATRSRSRPWPSCSAGPEACLRPAPGRAGPAPRSQPRRRPGAHLSLRRDLDQRRRGDSCGGMLHRGHRPGQSARIPRRVATPTVTATWRPAAARP